MSSFIVNHIQKDGYDILELKGELDAHTASHLEDALKLILDKDRNQIIVNCTSLDYIASAGLGVFMAYIEDVRALGGDIKLTNMTPRVYNVFDLLGFPTLYDILDDVSNAIEQFSSPQ
jgi:anti-sigma B factor antagonist